MNRLSRNEFSRSEASGWNRSGSSSSTGAAGANQSLQCRSGRDMAALGRRTAQVALITELSASRLIGRRKGGGARHTVRNGSGWKAAAHQPPGS